MNWDTQLDSILTATESNMAKIKERLYGRGESSRDLHWDIPRETSSPKLPFSYQSYTSSLKNVTPSDDLMNLNSKLLSQGKMITSLHEALGRLEQDRDQQQQRIHCLEDELRHLREAQGNITESVLQGKVDKLRNEFFNKLRMRDSIVQDPCQGRHSTAYILQEVTENKRLLWKEYESLRRDVDFLHEKLRRQEDDMLRQLSMCQEVKRSQDRNAKMLEGILSNQQSHSLERTRTMSDTLGLQRDLLQIRAEIVDLKENIRILERNLNVAVSIPKDEDEQVKPLAQRKKTTELASSSDTASQLSLSDISSEDTSYSLNDTAPSKGLRATTEHSSQGKKTRTILDDFSDDLDEVCGSPPELNFSDL